MQADLPCAQSRYISKVGDSERRGCIVDVHNKHMDAFDGLSRIELWWVRNGGRGRYKREGWFAHCGVLVERNEFRELREANVRIQGD